MAIAREPKRHRTSMPGALAVALACVAPFVAGAAGPLSPGDAWLDGLKGEWIMSGTVHATAVEYHARGERVLRGAFMRFHMIDAAPAPEYEAELYIGYDAGKDDYVAHWLDRFGAAGSRVVATGKRQGERLVLNFPYAEGAFRDTFTRDAKSGAWTLRLESQAADGSWSKFAEYSLARDHHCSAPSGRGGGYRPGSCVPRP